MVRAGGGSAALVSTAVGADRRREDPAPAYQQSTTTYPWRASRSRAVGPTNRLTDHCRRLTAPAADTRGNHPGRAFSATTRRQQLPRAGRPRAQQPLAASYSSKQAPTATLERHAPKHPICLPSLAIVEIGPSPVLAPSSPLLVGEITAMDRIAFRGKQTPPPRPSADHLTISPASRARQAAGRSNDSSPRRDWISYGKTGGLAEPACRPVGGANATLPDCVWWIELAAPTDVSRPVVATLTPAGTAQASPRSVAFAPSRPLLHPSTLRAHLVAGAPLSLPESAPALSRSQHPRPIRESLGFPASSLSRAALASRRVCCFSRRARRLILAGPTRCHFATWNSGIRSLRAARGLPLVHRDGGCPRARIDVMSEQNCSAISTSVQFLTSSQEWAPAPQQLCRAIDWILDC